MPGYTRHGRCGFIDNTLMSCINFSRNLIIRVVVVWHTPIENFSGPLFSDTLRALANGAFVTWHKTRIVFVPAVFVTPFTPFILLL
jgi:hypothetical protein